MMRRLTIVLTVLVASQFAAIVLAGPPQEESSPARESVPAEIPVELTEEELTEGEEEPFQEESPEEELSGEGESREQEGLAGEEDQVQEEEAVSEEASLSLSEDGSTGLLFQFNNIPIRTVIDTVMQELGYSYVVDPAVSGTASIYTMGEIPREKAFEILEQLLQMNGQAVVRQDDGLFVFLPLGASTRIPQELVVNPSVSPSPQEAPTESPSQEELPTQADPVVPESSPQPAQETPSEEESLISTAPPPVEIEAGDREGVSTYVITLHHIPSDEMLSLITPFLSNGAQVINYASANMIFLTDHQRNVQQVLRLVQLLDTEYFDTNKIDLIPIRFNLATEIAEDLGQIFAPRAPAGVRIVAIERLNSLLVVTRSLSLFQEVRGWIEKLDSPPASASVKTFVYQVENNTATNIASILGELYQDGLGLNSLAGEPGETGQGASVPRGPEAAPVTQQGLGRFQGSTLGPSLAGRPVSSQSGVRSVISGNVKIIVNEFNNSLIIQATEADYQFMLETIRQLDVLPRQVLIEANIYTVELRNELSFGVSAFLRERQSGGADPDNPGQILPLGPATSAQIAAPTSSSPSGALSLMTRTFIGQSRQLDTIINALRSRTNVEILEAPRILTMDGVQAQINVGAEVPVTTASFGDPLQGGNQNNFINSIQFRPTGVTLLILPRISASGVVTMDLAIEVSSASGAALTPTINRNFVTTSLIVQDGQTVAIAGIISDQFDFSRNRVPILGDIPIIGALFGQTARSKRRAELIFFITPHVIRNLPTATELTLDFRRALRRAYDVILEKESEQDELIQERRDRELQNQQ